MATLIKDKCFDKEKLKGEWKPSKKGIIKKKGISDLGLAINKY